MFGMLRTAFTLLICLLIVGFYLGWFSFTKSAPDPKSDNLNVNVSVDKQKMGADLQKLEQNVAKRIQDINSQPQGSAAPPAVRQPLAPSLNLGPITVQPNLPGQFSGQTPGPPVAPPQTPDYQFTVPLGVPPPGQR
jgi:hypothetical protein